MEIFANAAGNFWLPLGVLAFVFGIAGLACALRGMKSTWAVLLASSLSCGVLALLAAYFLVFGWVQQADWSALMDVIPGMTGIFTICTLAGLVLNGVTLAVGIRSRK